MIHQQAFGIGPQLIWDHRTWPPDLHTLSEVYLYHLWPHRALSWFPPSPWRHISKYYRAQQRPCLIVFSSLLIPVPKGLWFMLSVALSCPYAAVFHSGLHFHMWQYLILQPLAFSSDIKPNPASLLVAFTSGDSPARSFGLLAQRRHELLALQFVHPTLMELFLSCYPNWRCKHTLRAQ